MAGSANLTNDFAAEEVGEEGELSSPTGTKLVRSLGRALDILSSFDVEHPSWDLPSLSRNVNLHKATAHRLAKTLEAKGFLTYDPATGRYHVGPALMKIAYTDRAETELVRIARPHMERLAADTGETVDLAVWTGDGMLLVAQVLTSRPFRPEAGVGRFFPDIANAGSKIHLAFTVEPERARYLARPQQRFTPFTKVDPEAIAAEIDRVAEEGVAYDLQETSLGVVAAAAPVRDAGGLVRAVIAVVCPPERFRETDAARHVRSLKAAAAALSLDLGYQDQSADAWRSSDHPAQATSGAVV